MPLHEEFKDWICFSNQFTVEGHRSSISEISEFYCLLELVKEKQGRDILGLPHPTDGYRGAKRILEETYDNNIMVHKALIKDIGGFLTITGLSKVQSIHDLYHQLSRAARTLKTVGKINSVQCLVYTDKLGPVGDIIAEQDSS